MHSGYPDDHYDLVDGLSTYLRAKGLHSPAELVGRALPALTDWGHLDQSFRLLAQIDEARCVDCNLCPPPAMTGAHQAIRREGTNGTSRLVVDGDHCVGCHLCQYVCPVEGCISMVELEGPAAVHSPMPTNRPPESPACPGRPVKQTGRAKENHQVTIELTPAQAMLAVLPILSPLGSTAGPSRSCPKPRDRSSTPPRARSSPACPAAGRPKSTPPWPPPSGPSRPGATCP